MVSSILAQTPLGEPLAVHGQAPVYRFDEYKDGILLATIEARFDRRVELTLIVGKNGLLFILIYSVRDLQCYYYIPSSLHCNVNTLIVYDPIEFDGPMWFLTVCHPSSWTLQICQI